MRSIKYGFTFVLFVICVCAYVLALMYYPAQTVIATILATIIQAIGDYRKAKKKREEPHETT